ncbi:hypothetical protein C8R46DRAFT_1218234 [Mycena filopes]|nr:hypothetical protein C8R46DRAFT_1218234 [Mycena filopes]
MFTSNITPPAQKELDRIAALYEVSDAQLKKITDAFGDAFNKGLQVEHQPVTMGPSWVTHSPDGTEKGTVLTLEFGWDNVRVADVQLDGNRSFITRFKTTEITHDMMYSEATVFFNFLAGCISKFLNEHKIDTSKTLRLGFNFAFGAEKSSLDHGKLLAWSKGFSISGVIGEDVVELLQKAIGRAKLNVKCTALINDSVAVLLGQSYLEKPCIMSVVYGAGTNGAYLESGASITKLPQFRGTSMMINTEWGMFDNAQLLKPTEWDLKMDSGAAHPGTALFQKLTCWFYLGEIARQIFLSLVDQRLLFNGVSTDLLKKHSSLTTFHLFQIEDAKDHATIKEVLVETFGYSESDVSNQDVEIARRVATIIAVRAGKLAATPIASLLVHLGYGLGQALTKIPIAVEGELFIGSAQFETRLKQGVAAILGRGYDERVDFHHVEGKGYVGAAIACLEAEHIH